MSRWRDLLLISVLFGILIGFTIWGPGRNQPEAFGQPGSTRSSSDRGAYGLFVWLRELGYDARRLEFRAWAIPDEAAALFIIAPRAEAITSEQAVETLRWVRNGGTLVLVVPDPPSLLRPNALLDELGATVAPPDDSAPAERADVSQPLLIDPPVTSVRVRATAALQLDRDDYAPILMTQHGPTLVGIQEGRGYVYLATTAYPFTNGGIREPGSAALILNLLRGMPRDAIVLFDEYHHGYNRPPSLRATAFEQGWGWPALYVFLVIGGYLALSGRRFGRAVPLREDVQQRSSAEYVQSLAALLRRAGKREYIARHFHAELKRRLARPYGFAPPDEDDAFVRELQRMGGATNEQATQVRDLLHALSSAPDDEQLVRLVRRIDALIDERGRLR